MRRVLAVLASAVLMVVLAGSALAGQNGQGQNGYALRVSGWRLSPADVPAFQIAVSALINAGHATGTFRFGNATLDLKGSATCGNVQDGTAVIGGRITSSTDPALEGTFVQWFIDSGAQVFGNWGPDQSSVLDVGVLLNPYLPADFPVHCPPAVGQAFDFVATYGLRTVLGDVSISSSGNQNGQ